MIRLTFKRGRFLCRCDFVSREIPKDAGFSWDAVARRWYTETPRVAAKLREHADDEARKEIDRLLLRNSPWLSPLPYPSHLKPYPFQLEAARFALARNRSYLGLDPGLGKTPTAAIVANALAIPTVVICPPFLTRNTQAEFEKWSTWKPKIVRLESGLGLVKGLQESANILIVPDSLLTKLPVQGVISGIAKSHPQALLVVDEAHRYKTPDAQRTRALFETIAPQFSRQVFLSGTPMPNRPIELYPVLANAAPETINFRNRHKYALRYCAAKHDGFGWDYSGHSNLPELREKVIGTFMLRMKKKDVMKELPPKTEEIVVIGDRPAKLIALEEKILAAHSPADLVAHQVTSDHIASYRRELGLLKMKSSLDFIRSLLDEGEESLLVFAYHKDVIAALETKLGKYRPLVITGATPNAKRHEIVKTFQEDADRRLFIGNYQAAGVGLTLTKATRVVFVEIPWVPAELEQASDRAHRIGQRDHVFVQLLVFANSLDRAVVETILSKRKVIGHI
jgi:SWI/SNF-related matrix-associated actin-dependent regulator 1 of chromatin subfamily A